jgi:ppGpp synthetase/RelA/SpoT-type nucleotidyltranferase
MEMFVSLIEEFLDHYNRELDFFAEVARTVQLKIESALLAHGVRAIVTSRAKRPDRLRQKLLKRNKEKQYKDFKDIYKDIIDLAGVRVALYFPADRERVRRVVGELFSKVRKPKTFPVGKTPRPGKRFIGYVATHYLVRLKSESLQDMQRRYADTAVQIQVASVLMHAWAEVEHDLVYKPEKGDLSEDELAILDEINGMVLSGEIALERLQRAIERRSSKNDVPFNDQFELASYLAQRAVKLGMSPSDIGKVNVLINVLRALRQDSPAKLRRYLEQVAPEDKASPIADVVIDKVLFSQSKRTTEKLSGLISKTMSRDRFGVLVGDQAEAAVGYFLIQWIGLEKTLARLVPQTSQTRFSISDSMRQLKLDPSLISEIQNLRSLRNMLVHGLQTPDPATLRDKGKLIQKSIIPAIRQRGIKP